MGACDTQSHCHGQQDSEGDRRPAMLAERLGQSSPEATEGRLLSRPLASQLARLDNKELSLQRRGKVWVRHYGLLLPANFEPPGGAKQDRRLLVLDAQCFRYLIGVQFIQIAVQAFDFVVVHLVSPLVQQPFSRPGAVTPSRNSR